MMNLFSNTERAFADKSTEQLQKAYWMFKVIQNLTLTRWGTSALNFVVENKFPLVNSLLRATLFEQFCGGETREESMKTVDKLYKRGVGCILDYSAEGKAEDAVFDAICDEIKDLILLSIGNPAIPFVVFKPTAFGRIEIYETVGKGKDLTSSEKEEWNRVKQRYDAICSLCHEKNVVVMIDAEETWMQDAADALVEEMMERYNKEKAIVWNTIQLYRTHRLEYMEKDLARAKEKGYFIGYKLVRGAYMEKERERAEQMGYPSPIQPTKEAADQSFDDAVAYCLNHTDVISVFVGTHNERSTELMMDQMKTKGLGNNHPNVYSGQLYGMSDHITYYLSEHQYNVAKYLPYGEIKDVIPYLTRRAEENTSIAGQTTRELSLIKKELDRRKQSQTK